MKKETEKNTSNVVQWSKAYTFDKAGNRETMTVTGSENYVTSYSYDKNNRLLGESKISGGTETVSEYYYDKNGNQLSKTSYSLVAGTANNPQMGIYAIGVANPSLLDSYVAEIFEYDVLNQLLKVTNNKGISEYVYKPDGLRLSKSVSGSKTIHIWDGSNIVLEVDENNVVKNKYVRGIGLIKNQLDYYFLFNAHGDVVHLANVSGTVTRYYNYRYDAFGVEIDPNLKDDNPFRYCGEYTDLETNSLYLRARYYNPTVGRFLTEDTYRGKPNDPLSLNLYTYCHNNPNYYHDPSGNMEYAIQLMERID